MGRPSPPAHPGVSGPQEPHQAHSYLVCTEGPVCFLQIPVHPSQSYLLLSLFFGHALQHVGSQFSSQDLKPCSLH